MMQDLFSKISTCTIFWSPDFSNWRTAIDDMYPNSIENIMSFRVFKSSVPITEFDNVFLT